MTVDQTRLPLEETEVVITRTMLRNDPELRARLRAIWDEGEQSAKLQKTPDSDDSSIVVHEV